jgi:hypothetical protein
MRDLIEAGLRQSLRSAAVRTRLTALESQVRDGAMMPTVAAEDVLRLAGVSRPMLETE